MTTLFKVTVFASTDDWRVSVKKYEAKETNKSFLIKDYSDHRLAKDKVGKIDTISIDSTSCISRYMYVLNEDEICLSIENLIDNIKNKASVLRRDIEKLIYNTPSGKLDKSKLVIETVEPITKFTLTDDML